MACLPGKFHHRVIHISCVHMGQKPTTLSDLQNYTADTINYSSPLSKDDFEAAMKKYDISKSVHLSAVCMLLQLQSYPTAEVIHSCIAVMPTAIMAASAIAGQMAFDGTHSHCL